MTPADRWRLGFLSFILFSLFFLILTYIPTYIYVLLLFGGTCVVCYYKAEELQLLDRLGLNPRRGLALLTVLKHWLAARTGSVASTTDLSRTWINKSDVKKSLASPGDRYSPASVYRREPAFSDSVFSPRDLLMGSYLAKTDRPGGNSNRDQLRERLSRPNYSAQTPNRRLSFGEPVVVGGRFTITPQRHYPLQQPGTSTVGVFPPAQWDGFQKKNILTQRNAIVHSPVTVKIARPEKRTSSPFFPQLNSPGPVTTTIFEPQADPCSRETVLNMLKVSRKRDVDDEDKSHETEQRSKRRRNDSSGSSHSAFEPLLANGAPSQLVPKPGSLKRGLNISVLEESTLKRSRTSSISSVTGCPVSCGVPGSVRNPISSSYSSQGYTLKRLGSSLNLTPVSPGSSRCPTPERSSKKSKEENDTSETSVSPVKSDVAATESASGSGEHLTPDAPVIFRSDSAGNSSGKSKRKIPLVSMCRGDQISLPAPPELGYTITVKDLDLEKKATLSQIQKVFEEPEPEKLNPVPKPKPSAAVSLFTQHTQSSVSAAAVVSNPSLALFPTPTTGSTLISTAVSTQSPAPTYDLTISPMASAVPDQSAVPVTSASSSNKSPKVDNPLLESLRNTKNVSLHGVLSAFAATSTASAKSVVAQPPTFSTTTALSLGTVKPETSLAVPQPKVSTVPSCTTSAFAQILAQPPAQSSVNITFGEGSLFKSGAVKPTTSALAPTIISSPASTSTAPLTSIASTSSSSFKPIFGGANTVLVSTTEVKSTQPNDKSVFGNAFGQSATSLTSVPATQSSSALFGALSSQPLCSSGQSSLFNTQNPSASLFGGLNNSQSVTASVSSSVLNNQGSISSLFGGSNSTQTVVSSVPSSYSSTQNSNQSLFSGNSSSLPLAALVPSSGANTQNSSPSLFGTKTKDNGTLQFGATISAPASSAATTNTTSGSTTNTTFQFGAQTIPSTVPQSKFTFGQNPVTASFTGFANNPVVADTPTTQATFGSSLFNAPNFSTAHSQSSTQRKTFTFGGVSGGGNPPTATVFGAPANTAEPAFGSSTQAPFGGLSTTFSFGNTNTSALSASPAPTSTFTFGAAPATPPNSASSGGFNFSALVSGTQFRSPAVQPSGFPFGSANMDNKAAFGTSTPAFGAPNNPLQFGSPGTPVQGFGASAFSTPSANFSIGAGSKQGNTRQRLQARRQHARKK